MEEFIEIPFGAKDSELGGWEYNIPEGYTASIENGKIVVKKEKNMDEKIREALIDFFRDGAERNYSTSGVYDKDILVWLEKQGEQNHAWSEEDEEMLYSILNVLNGGLTSIPIGKYTNWLKSFKERVQPQWKPSEEQIQALNAINVTGGISYAGQGQVLIELYNDLLKLKA